MIFDPTSITPKSDSQNIDAMPVLDNEVTLEFFNFYFPYIL